MHGVRRTVLKRKPLPQDCLCGGTVAVACSNEIYEQRMAEVCRRAIAEHIEAVAFGDLFLEDVRAYRVRQLAPTGLEPLFPLWQIPTNALAREMMPTASARASPASTHKSFPAPSRAANSMKACCAIFRPKPILAATRRIPHLRLRRPHVHGAAAHQERRNRHARRLHLRRLPHRIERNRSERASTVVARGDNSLCRQNSNLLPLNLFRSTQPTPGRACRTAAISGGIRPLWSDAHAEPTSVARPIFARVSNDCSSLASSSAPPASCRTGASHRVAAHRLRIRSLLAQFLSWSSSSARKHWNVCTCAPGFVRFLAAILSARCSYAPAQPARGRLGLRAVPIARVGRTIFRRGAQAFFFAPLQLRSRPIQLPGCVYSEMKMCLAPCYKGCTDEPTSKKPLASRVFFEREAKAASSLSHRARPGLANLEFESAAALHAQVQRVESVRALAAELVRPLSRLRALILQASARPDEVASFSLKMVVCAPRRLLHSWYENPE